MPALGAKLAIWNALFSTSLWPPIKLAPFIKQNWKYSYPSVTFIQPQKEPFTSWIMQGTLTLLWWLIDHRLNGRVKWSQRVSLDISILQLWPTGCKGRSPQANSPFWVASKMICKSSPCSCLSFHVPHSHGFLPYSPNEELAHRLQGIIGPFQSAILYTNTLQGGKQHSEILKTKISYFLKYATPLFSLLFASKAECFCTTWPL